MIVRRAVEGDSAVLLAWRNDPLTRMNSLERAAVSREEHEAWFAARRASEGTEIWIAEIDGIPVGQVRLDDEGEGTAVVDVTVAPDRRAQGVGSQLLRLVIARQTLNPQRLRALVRHENAASEALFTGAGFARVGETPDCVVLEHTLRGGSNQD